MNRPMFLAMNGWYPGSLETCKKEIESFINNKIFIEGKIPISCIVPHAGWYFCGDISVNCIRILKEKNGEINNVIIFGGHLGESNLAILETFDYAETPFGKLENDKEILAFLKKDERIQTLDYLQDNTIEVLLPIIHYYFGNKIKITAIYLPPNTRLKNLLESFYNNFGKNSVFIGSTDLTHYGPNYGFYHNDHNISSIDWVSKVNDKNYIDLLLEMRGNEALEYALKNHSACSAGASYGALIIAKTGGARNGTLMHYSTSYDKHKSESFVGYAGIIY